MDPRNLIPIAYHESGHAVMAYWLGHQIAGDGVWIAEDGLPREGAVGRAFTQRPSEKPPSTKERVMMVLAGHLAAHRWMVVEHGEPRAREWHERGGFGRRHLLYPAHCNQAFVAADHWIRRIRL